MSAELPVHLVPRDPQSPPLTLSAPQLSISLAQTWKRWHPDQAPWDEFDDVDERVRELAQCHLERIWDELTALGMLTPEITDFELFPSPIVGYRPRLLTLVPTDPPYEP